MKNKPHKFCIFTESLYLCSMKFLAIITIIVVGLYLNDYTYRRMRQ